MRTLYIEDLANHDGPEPCVGCPRGRRRSVGRGTRRRAIEPRQNQFGVPTLSDEAEGNIVDGIFASRWRAPRGRGTSACVESSDARTGRSHGHPACGCQWPSVSPQIRPKIPRWWPSFRPAGGHQISRGTGEPAGQGVHPLGGAAEVGEERGSPEGNATGETRPGHGAGNSVPSELDRVRQVARQDRDVRFTALLHHVDVDRLRAAYQAIRPKAAPGVDGVTWGEYGLDLEKNLRDLPARSSRELPGEAVAEGVHTEAGWAAAAARSRGAGGQDRPAGGGRGAECHLRAGLPRIFVRVRPGRSPHYALDALATGILRKKVSWVLDADLRDFFSTLDHQWLERFLVRAPDRGQTGPAADPEMAGCGGHREQDMDGVRSRRAARGFSFTASGERLLALRP